MSPLVNDFDVIVESCWVESKTFRWCLL